MSVSTSEPLTETDLRSLFCRPPDAAELIGVEIETAVVDPATGRAVPYLGEYGMERLLEVLLAEIGGEPIRDRGHLTGFTQPSGLSITLEHGGALEYSSAPGSDLAAVVGRMRESLTWVSEVAAQLGMAVMPGGNLPFDLVHQIRRVPKTRGDRMAEYFDSLGEVGRWGPTVMTMTLSTQVTLDYLDEDDLREKIRMQVAASPVVAAMFVNSPIEGGAPTGVLSRRGQCWQKTDPTRCGVLTPALRDDMRVQDFVDWAAALPMMYHRVTDDDYQRGSDRPFRELLVAGFADGTLPDLADWQAHLSQIWTDVRLRETLEMRAADGPAWPNSPAIPALWTGLSYHRPSRDAAWSLLKAYRPADLRAASEDLIKHGLSARIAGDSVRELGAELLRLASDGLAARVRAGLERPEVVAYLDPLVEVIESGRTFAEETLARWEGDLAGDPARYVAAHRI
ncbi:MULTISPECIES: glutamate-cysteine ligase family protein [Actinoalloteichus]|uniref:Glutamate--cysteine ligase n=1 Tax=Actinoalloteichus fjordicus TaxID=1612552 RepID=A0AAC9PU35_9PSEU|nr:MULTISPECIES: glutamate-cysteine ligase family protein [Actinoalloteichus]APU16702.1 gamma-glutamylcysteine synthetase [Actinoalloteichus fjordicus]APU22768.1 gamma-glutamylcysteine synthetase [Actinoalloteichus sp. GBA129-24]